MQILFLERIGLDKGVHASILSISDPQTASSASESTSFCATCAVVVYFACLARLLMNFS